MLNNTNANLALIDWKYVKLQEAKTAMYEITVNYVMGVKKHATGQERRYILRSKSTRVRMKWEKKMEQRILETCK